LRQCAISPFLTTPLSKRTIEKERNELLQRLMKDIHTHDRLGKWCFDRDGGAGIHAEKISKELEILQNIPKGEKVLFFTMFTSYSDLVVKALEKRMPGYGFLQVDGDTKGRERAGLIKQFKEDPRINLLLLTYKVGGEGLNLTEATHCICGEPWWTNAVHSQAESRIHRSGQKKECHIYYVVSTNTIEKKVLDICAQKEKMASSYLDETERPIGKVGLDRFTLGKILGVFA
jgi:SNF2 family DNA or RNA helicase